jgi:hypothetical protein
LGRHADVPQMPSEDSIRWGYSGFMPFAGRAKPLICVNSRSSRACKPWLMERLHQDLTDLTNQPFEDDLWVFVAMALVTFVLAVAILLGSCVHV